MRTVASTAAAVIGTALMVGTPTVAYGAALKVVNASGVGSRGTCNAFVTNAVGSGCFQGYGEHFWVTGEYSDTRVALHWKTGDGSQRGLIRWTRGERYSTGEWDTEIPEGKRVGIRLGYCTGGGCDSLSEVQFLGDWDWTTS